MPIEKLTALIIRQVDFSETSRVVTFYTRELGKLSCLAKGAKRIRGPFSGALDLLSVCRIVLIRKGPESLSILTEAELVERFSPQRNRLHVLYAGCYVAELLRELNQDYDPHPTLFDVACETLRELESCEDTVVAIRRMELASLRETGHLPRFDGCAICGLDVSSRESVSFSVAAGGVVCPVCLPRAGATVRLKAGSLSVMTLLARATGGQWRRLQLMNDMGREIEAVTRACILNLVGRHMVTGRFLGEHSS